MKVAIFGAGIWGSSTALYLSRSGIEVTLVEPWGSGHARAGSGGASRIIRMGYGSDEIYIDLTAQSFLLWNQLLKKDREQFYRHSKALWLFSDDDASYILSSIPAINSYGGRIDELSIENARSKYPQISFEGIKRVFIEHRAGILFANRCCSLVTKEAIAQGSQYISGFASVDFSAGKFSVSVNNRKINADYFIFACGPWTRNLFPDLLLDYTYVSKQDSFYFTAPLQSQYKYDTDGLPVWLEYDKTSPLYYGMPTHRGLGFKIAYDDRSESFDLERNDRIISTDRLKGAKKFMNKRFPTLRTSKLAYSEVCVYDNSTDGHFIIDHHPLYHQIILMTGSSGHGFKMGPSLGVMIRNHLIDGISLPEEFKLSRFTEDFKRCSQFLSG